MLCLEGCCVSRAHSRRSAYRVCRIDNLIYAPDTTDCVLALLDWELSTLGYPLADLAYSAMCYHFPSSDKTGVRGLPRPLPEGALLNMAHRVSRPLCKCLPCVPQQWQVCVPEQESVRCACQQDVLWYNTPQHIVCTTPLVSLCMPATAYVQSTFICLSLCAQKQRNNAQWQHQWVQSCCASDCQHAKSQSVSSPVGIPTEKEYIQMYCQARGIGVPDPTTYAFCQALSMFRIAAILAGVGARAQQGNASSKHAAQVCEVTASMINTICISGLTACLLHDKVENKDLVLKAQAET